MDLTTLAFFGALQTASWRGVPFGVTGAQLKAGRRTSLHEYPFRDEVWVEDLGRAGRRIGVTGFLVQDAAYGGADSVIDQRRALIAACETADDGELIHPSLGSLRVSLLEFECEEATERGRVFSLHFTFAETGTPQFPTLTDATQAQTELSAVAAFAKQAQDFLNETRNVLTTPPIVGEIERTARNFVNEATAITERATSLVAMVSVLQGEFGRFVGQFAAGIKLAASVDDLIGAGARAREAVRANGEALTDAARHSDYDGMIEAAQALVGAVRLANPDPHQAVQSLLALQAATATQPRATRDLSEVNRLTVNLYRRDTVIAIARCTETYALASIDDAQALRKTVIDALGAEIDTAGNAGEDASFDALRALQAAVVLDLTVRGQSMAAMQTVHTPQSVPLIVLAQRLYQDVARYDGLLQQAKPIHPAFPPTSFRAPLQ